MRLYFNSAVLSLMPASRVDKNRANLVVGS